MMQPDPIDERIRELARGGESTRRIARALGMAQSTVVRRQQKINTGPNPILQPGYRPRRRLPAVPPAAAVAVALILLATVAVILLLTRLDRNPGQIVPVTVCVRYDAAGAVTGITAGGGCPPGWETVTLTPAG